MYIPKAHAETDLAVLHSLIRSHPLGTWVTLADTGQGESELVANHIPFLLDTACGEYGVLIGHVARANPVWKSFSTRTPSVVAFQGADAYVSPSWYPEKHIHGKAVPTWNYATVHVYGLPAVFDDPERLLRHVAQLSDTHEASQRLPWKVADAPDEYIQKMLGAIVGIEIPIAKLTGKWKVSQNRPTADRLGVVAGLTARGTDSAKAMAEMVRRFVPEIK